MSELPKTEAYLYKVGRLFRVFAFHDRTIALNIVIHYDIFESDATCEEICTRSKLLIFVQHALHELKPTSLNETASIYCRPCCWWHTYLKHEAFTIHDSTTCPVRNLIWLGWQYRLFFSRHGIIHQLKSETKHIETIFFCTFEQFGRTTWFNVVITVNPPNKSTTSSLEPCITSSTQSLVLLVDDYPTSSFHTRLLFLSTKSIKHFHRIIGRTIVHGNYLIIFRLKALIPYRSQTTPQPLADVINWKNNT